jgi:hypothetical protein
MLKPKAIREKNVTKEMQMIISKEFQVTAQKNMDVPVCKFTLIFALVALSFPLAFPCKINQLFFILLFACCLLPVSFLVLP